MFRSSLRYFSFGIVNGLIALNVVVFLLQLATDRDPWLVRYFALSSFGWEEGRYYQLFTYMWLHGGFAHLLFNMIGLWVFGRELEPIAGRWHFIFLYLLSGLAGGILWIIFNLNSLYPMIGASASVLGLVTAFAVLFPRVPLLIFPLPFPVQARWMAVGYTLLTLIFIFRGALSQVAHLAHLGGIVVGFVYARFFLVKRMKMFPTRF
ncbi:MAG: rhomboid family intramembrane serine protease [Verrucomicrobiae bacterium]|nr:rhomboid family intramembrane serine protease [Verrucomicrobiae bacterium]